MHPRAWGGQSAGVIKLQNRMCRSTLAENWHSTFRVCLLLFNSLWLIIRYLILFWHLGVSSQEQYKIFSQMPSGWKWSPSSLNQSKLFTQIDWKKSIDCEIMSFHKISIKYCCKKVKKDWFVNHLGYNFHPPEPYLHCHIEHWADLILLRIPGTIVFTLIHFCSE